MRHRLLALAAAVFLGSTLAAAALDKPTGPVILTVTGAISQTNGPGIAEFDLAMLDALPSRTTTAETPWTTGKPSFKGPLVRAVLEAVGAKGTMLKVTALNDYSAEVPVEDVMTHEVILATTLDGNPMSVRDKGPIFVIYPFDTEPDLFTETYFNRSVWQLATIDVK